MLLDTNQTRNFLEALSITSDPALQERLAFAIWTESTGHNYANDGRNMSNSPGFTANTSSILRQSLNYSHDLVGSNGRSTGILQQTSSDVGGGWGSMIGTMQPAISAQRCLDQLVVTNNSVYSGILLTSSGSQRVNIQLSDAIAADVLRFQQPLASEAQSSNYNAAQVATARDIVVQLGLNIKPVSVINYGLERS